MSYKTNLLFVVGAMAAITVMTTPASAGTVYWCKDGTAVSHKSSCDSHGGLLSAPRQPKPGTAGRQSISDQGAAGNLSSYRSRQKARDGLPDLKKGRTFLDGGASVGRTKAGQIPRGRKISDNENPRPVDRFIITGAGAGGGPHRR